MECPLHIVILLNEKITSTYKITLAVFFRSDLINYKLLFLGGEALSLVSLTLCGFLPYVSISFKKPTNDGWAVISWPVFTFLNSSVKMMAERSLDGLFFQCVQIKKRPSNDFIAIISWLLLNKPTNDGSAVINWPLLNKPTNDGWAVIRWPVIWIGSLSLVWEPKEWCYLYTIWLIL